MADAPSKILKIRTLANDIKRAGGDTTLITPSSSKPQNTVPEVPPTLSAIVIPTAQPVLKSIPPSQTPPPVALTPSAPTPAPIPGSAFDIRHEEKGVGGEVTILSDRPSRSTNIVQAVFLSLGEWFTENILPYFTDHSHSEDHTYTPAFSTPASTVAPHTSIAGSVRTFAQDMAGAHQETTYPTPVPEKDSSHLIPASPAITLQPIAISPPHKTEPPVPSSSWRPISENLMHKEVLSVIPPPVPMTTQDEIALVPTQTPEISPRQALQEALAPYTITAIPAKQPFKTARPIRPITPSQASSIPEILPTTPKESAHERLKRLVEASAEPPLQSEERLQRDIPFIPPPAQEVSAAPVRTYRHDALSDIRDQDLSKTRIAAAERERSDRTGIPVHETTPPRKPFPLLWVATSALSVIVLIGLSVTFYVTRNTSPTATPVDTAVLTASRIQPFTLPPDRVAFLQEVSRIQQETTLSEDEILALRADVTSADGSRPARAEEVLRVLDPRAPSAFIRSQTTAPFFGLYGASRTPFVIFTTSNFDTAYAGMLAWESYMSVDMTPFLGSPVRRSYDAGSLTIDQTREAYFVDTIIQNTDVRILYNENGEARILYAFPNPTTVIITTTPEALTALMQELR